MNDNKSVNLNTRDIRETAVESRIIKTILRPRPPSGSRFAVLELSTKAVKLLIGRDVVAIRDNLNRLGSNASGAKFNFDNFFRTSDKVEAGKGLDAHNVMDMGFFSRRVLKSILHKKKLMLESGVDTVYTVATAAYRTATNREEILDLIRERAGINVRILSKKEESLATLFAYTFTSAYRARVLQSPRAILIDQGGGSTEVSVFKEECNLIASYSINLGTTALHNFLFKDSRSDTPLEQALKNSDRKVKERLVTFSKNMDQSMAVGGEAFCVGVGTAITRATGKIGNAKQHDAILTKEFISDCIVKAEKIILERVKNVGELDAMLGTIGPNDPLDGALTTRLGLPMFVAIMERYGIPEIHVSGTGLWYGIYIQGLWNALDED